MCLIPSPFVVYPQPLVSALPISAHQMSRVPGFGYQESTQTRSADGHPSHLTTSSSSSRGPDRDRDRDKKKKKHKRRSRSRSRSRSKTTTKHSLPSAYRSYRRSRYPQQLWSCCKSFKKPTVIVNAPRHGCMFRNVIMTFKQLFPSFYPSEISLSSALLR